MSQQFAAETCPNCNGTKKEPLAVFERQCDFCGGHGLVSHFKLALWISLGNKLPEKKNDD